MRVVIPLLLTAAGLVTVGCSPAAGNTSPVIEMRPHADFEPAGASISPGDRIVWSNVDDVRHRIVLEDGRSFDVAPGDVAVLTFDEPGRWLARDLDQAEMLAVIDVHGPRR